MNEKTIRCPKGPAIIFLIQALSLFFNIFSTTLLGEISGSTETMSITEIVKIGLWGATYLYMSIVLFSKKYDNTLMVAAGALLIPSVVGLFINITPYGISEIIYRLLFIAFTYIMIKMTESPIREKLVKFRFAIPVFQFVLILISTVQTILALREGVTETMGAHPDSALNIAIIMIPTILGAVAGFLPVLCDVLLVNWLADPYNTQE